MTELRVRDLFTLSTVLGLMIGTMSFFMHIFANGMDVSDLEDSEERPADGGHHGHRRHPEDVHL